MPPANDFKNVKFPDAKAPENHAKQPQLNIFEDSTLADLCGAPHKSATRRGHPKNRMFDNSPMQKELLDCGAVTLTVPVLSEFVKLRLAKLEADHQRGIPFNEAIGNDTLGLDIMARGVLQDWLATLFNQYDQIAAKLLPAVEAATIKPKITLPIGELLSAKRGAKVNLTN